MATSCLACHYSRYCVVVIASLLEPTLADDEKTVRQARSLRAVTLYMRLLLPLLLLRPASGAVDLECHIFDEVRHIF